MWKILGHTHYYLKNTPIVALPSYLRITEPCFGHLSWRNTTYGWIIVRFSTCNVSWYCLPIVFACKMLVHLRILSEAAASVVSMVATPMHTRCRNVILLYYPPQEYPTTTLWRCFYTSSYNIWHQFFNLITWVHLLSLSHQPHSKGEVADTETHSSHDEAMIQSVRIIDQF